MKLLKKWRHIIDWYFFQSEKAGRAEAVNFISHLFIYSFFLFFPFVFSVLFIYNEQNRWYCYQQIRLIFHFSCYVNFFYKLILVVHFCASTLHYLFWYILIQKRRKQNSFFIEHLWWVLLKMSVNRAVGSFFIFYSSPPPKKRNLDQNVNDSKFHFVILFLKIIFQTYTTFSYLSKRSSGHHQGFLWFQIF